MDVEKPRRILFLKTSQGVHHQSVNASIYRIFLNFFMLKQRVILVVAYDQTELILMNKNHQKPQTNLFRREPCTAFIHHSPQNTTHFNTDLLHLQRLSTDA